MKRVVVLGLLGLLGLLGGLGGLAGCGAEEPPRRAQLVDADGNVLMTLTLAVADTEYERREGLRLHGPLAQDEALLMTFPSETRVCITNAGVPFSIDILFLAMAGQVVGAERGIPANAPGPYCHPAQQVLELQGDSLPTLNQAKLELF